MKIRAVRDEDRNAIAALHLKSWRATYQGLLSDGFLSDTAPTAMQEKWQQAVFSDRLIVLVAEDSCALAGFIALKRFDVDAPLIDNLHVDPAAHGRGIGRALMQAGAARLLAEGDIGVRLIVLEGNSAARAFYARLGGLEGAHFIDDFFGTPEAALYIIWDDLSALC